MYFRELVPKFTKESPPPSEAVKDELVLDKEVLAPRSLLIFVDEDFVDCTLDAPWELALLRELLDLPIIAVPPSGDMG